MSDFVVWARKLATQDYLSFFYRNYMRIKTYGARKTKTDQKFQKFLESIPKNVSSIPYEARNSEQYFQECPTEAMIIGDFSICESVATEYIECAELCATSEYYMNFCQRKNGLLVLDPIFDDLQSRAYHAGVSKVPYDTKRSSEYQKNISFLLAPIAKYC